MTYSSNAKNLISGTIKSEFGIKMTRISLKDLIQFEEDQMYPDFDLDLAPRLLILPGI